MTAPPAPRAARRRARGASRCTPSDSQIAAFERLPHLNPNNRPVQPLNGRDMGLQSGH
ncbi:hypothetical protein [Myxococcus sp. AB036A]|uniref:hypothetical protein n=1 Tax=Myxococcus sp. AB036A TaxID=2562793 RepID=UPI001E5F3016|nr:hypothetical protein [Myxococcus sp. AB036A]